MPPRRKSPASSKPLPVSERPAFRRTLLAWYRAGHRLLPWRETRDPYAIWLSEVMLQQTTVRTVEPRWRAFLERFPTLAALATADEAEVLAQWRGLGYYARARNLHRAAKQVAAAGGDALPTSFELLLALPGMGRYTASAVASIAFGEPVAVLDANVERVVSRLVAYPDSIKTAGGRKALWALAEELLERAAPGDFNQAMMELGATVCLPRRPLCARCPVASWCAAHALGNPDAYPVLPERPEFREVREVAVAIERDGRLLILLRPPEGSFASMWELPRGEVTGGESSSEAAVRIARESTGLTIRPGALVSRLRHTVMTSRIQLTVLRAAIESGSVRAATHAAARWATPQEWLGLPSSSTQHRVARVLAGAPGPSADPSDEPDAPSGDLFSTSD